MPYPPTGGGITQTAADIRYAQLAVANILAGKLTAQGEVEIDGALNHDGATAGLYGVAPTAQAAAIATPTAPGAVYLQAEATSAKTAIDNIRTVLTNIGITL